MWCSAPVGWMVWTCRAQHRLDCRSTQAECGCTEKIRQAKEIMGWSALEWQKEARYGFCWPSKSFWVERTPSRKTCQKAQPSVEENRALKWIWWWWWDDLPSAHSDETEFRLLFYDIITVTLQFSHGFSTKCIGYNTNCIGAITILSLLLNEVYRL